AYAQAPATTAPATEPKPATTQPGLNPGEEPAKTTPAQPAQATGNGIWTSPAGENYGTSRVRFVLQAQDNLSGLDYIEYRVDTSEFRRYVAPLQLDKEGPHTIVYHGVDKAGNREVDQVYHVVTDNKAPDVSILAAKPFVVKNGRSFSSPNNSFTMRISDDFSGVKSVVYGVNSDEMKAYQDEVIKLTTPGSQLIQYTADDNLGNRAQGSLLIEVDGAKPTVEIVPGEPLMPLGDKMYAKRRTGFKINGTDNGSGVEQILIRVDGAQEWTTYSNVLYFDTEKEHSIEAKAIDAVGNESDVRKITFIVDDNPPTTDLRANVE
ncbi:MAG TPA: hypothetical protein PLD60_09250, partial [Leptospiraceae bacterium]|nr:hypothetical protein [Leptospiraceae bacterium]